MTQTQLSRKLAVILHADIVDSTTIVQTNELTAHHRIQETFTLCSNIIENYGGTVHELRGDALVAEFSRASDAVCAALKVQSQNIRLNKDTESAIDVNLRIGISLGEVIIADGTITGTGVILAQRLEQLAEPGGVVVHGTVPETIPARLPFEFVSLGEPSLKGFTKPIRAFAAHVMSGETIPDSETSHNSPATTADRPRTYRPSIAIMPFLSLSSDPEQEYFADGLTEDIITEFSRFHELFVISRNSSFAFKGKAIDSIEAGQNLGVEYLVEGSIRRSGNRIRVTAQLVDIKTGKHIWADRYDRDLEDIFQVQDEVVRIIASTLVGRVANDYREQTLRKPTSNLGAYDWFVQGRELFYNGNSEDNKKAVELFEKATLLDDEYAAAYALLAESYIRDWLTFWDFPVSESYSKAWENARRGLALDDTDSKTQAAFGIVNLFAGDTGQALTYLDKALSLNPGDIHALNYKSRYEVMAGNPNRALEIATEAQVHNPYGKYGFSFAPAFFMAQRFNDAIDTIKTIQNPAPHMRIWMAASYSRMGDLAEANKILSEYKDHFRTKAHSTGHSVPSNWLDFIDERTRFGKHSDREFFLDSLAMAEFDSK